MSIKMHLPAGVPSEGARLLAQWVGKTCHGNLVLAGLRLGLSTGTLQRLISGEVEPSDALVADITQGTRSAVRWRDWTATPRGGWFDLGGLPSGVVGLAARAQAQRAAKRKAAAGTGAAAA